MFYLEDSYNDRYFETYDIFSIISIIQIEDSISQKNRFDN